jgi:hypothetical protein
MAGLNKSTHWNSIGKVWIGQALQNEHEIMGRALPLASLLPVVQEQAECIPSRWVLDAPGEYTHLQQLLKVRVRHFSPIRSHDRLAPTEHDRGGMNPVLLHQCK